MSNDMQWTAHNSRSPADMAALGNLMADVLNENQQCETANELIDSGNYTYEPDASLPETIFMPRTMADRLVARVEAADAQIAARDKYIDELERRLKACEEQPRIKSAAELVEQCGGEGLIYKEAA